MSYFQKHPKILYNNLPLTHLIVRSTHARLSHAGPTLLSASPGSCYHIIGCKTLVSSIIRGYVTCRKLSTKPSSQQMGPLPLERMMPGPVFDKVGVDFAGPVQTKYGHVKKTCNREVLYISLFVSPSVKAVHLEPVSDLTSDAFIAALRRYVAKPSLITSDHGTNFVGANRELKEMYEFLDDLNTKGEISDFCSTQNIQRKFIPERSHYSGPWAVAVMSMKFHLKRVVGSVKLTFEELMTILAQVESCLNSRPLVPLSTHDDDGIEALTPGHFLIRQPLESLPDSSSTYRSLSLLQRWHLCQSIVRHFSKRWSSQYITSLRRNNKWLLPSRKIEVNDMVILHYDNVAPTRWPLARVLQVHPQKDGLVRVATVKVCKGVYKRPTCKLALLLPQDEQKL